MITVIQICLMLLAGYIIWCEYSPYFANTVKSITLRTLASTSMLGMSYHATLLNHYDYTTQSTVCLFVVLLTFYVAKLISNRYEYNFKRLHRIESYLMHKKEI